MCPIKEMQVGTPVENTLPGGRKGHVYSEIRFVIVEVGSEHGYKYLVSRSVLLRGFHNDIYNALFEELGCTINAFWNVPNNLSAGAACSCRPTCHPTSSSPAPVGVSAIRT